MAAKRKPTKKKRTTAARTARMAVVRKPRRAAAEARIETPAPKRIAPAARVRPPVPRPQSRPVTSSPIPDPDLPTPAQTSSHGSFDKRSALDPDKIPAGEKMLNEQFAEEDHYTNRTLDPRIGTHGRNGRR